MSQSNNDMISQSHNGNGDNIIVGGDFYNEIPKHPSFLSDVINVLANSFDDGMSEELGALNEITINDKIEFNNVKGFKFVIDEYKIYQGKIEAIYNVIEASGSNKKSLILKNIRNIYLITKADVFKGKEQTADELNIVKQNADLILENVRERLRNQIIKSANVEVSIEGIDVALSIIVVDAFIRCKILEEPKKD